MNGEAELFSERILRAIDRVVGSMDLLTAAQITWVPPVPGWNSMAAIVTHLLGNVEQNICGVIGGEPVERDREAEFTPHIETAAELREQWAELRGRVAVVIGALTVAEMGELRKHSWRGEITVREVLLIVVAHVGQHEGHAQMTRDYLLWQGPFVD